MSKVFKGRVVAPGELTAEAIVTHQGFNTLASLSSAGTILNREGKCMDQNNPDLYRKPVAGKALCLPETIGSTTGGMVLYSVGQVGAAPACMLFSKRADSLAIAGAALLNNFGNYKMPMIDELGDDFLEYVKTGMTIKIRNDGTVTVE